MASELRHLCISQLLDRRREVSFEKTFSYHPLSIHRSSSFANKHRHSNVIQSSLFRFGSKQFYRTLIICTLLCTSLIARLPGSWAHQIRVTLHPNIDTGRACPATRIDWNPRISLKSISEADLLDTSPQILHPQIKDNQRQRILPPGFFSRQRQSLSYNLLFLGSEFYLSNFRGKMSCEFEGSEAF